MVRRTCLAPCDKIHITMQYVACSHAVCCFAEEIAGIRCAASKLYTSAVHCIQCRASRLRKPVSHTRTGGRDNDIVSRPMGFCDDVAACAGCAALTIACLLRRLWRAQLGRLGLLTGGMFLLTALSADGIPPVVKVRSGLKAGVFKS